MSNSIRASILLASLAALALAACQRREERIEPKAEASAGAATVAATTPAAAPPSAQIDPPPASAQSAEIVAREDIVVSGKPACALTVRYVGLTDQPVTWQGERCEALTIRFLSVAELEKLGQGGKLTAETRDDVAALPDKKALYIEGEVASAVYPANSAERVYEVPLAD